MTGDRSLLKNFVEKFMGTVRFGNDHFAAITGYDDYVQGNITVCYVNYVEGLGHNLFNVRQFCDGDLEVAFRSKSCYVRNLEGDDLLTGDRESNLYTISISDMAAFLLVCLMSKATSTKSWLWHRRLSHLNCGTINDLTKHDMVDGLPKFKYGKDHLCSASSINEKRYILVIVDDYSRFTWVYFIRTKDETPEIINNFIARVQLNYNAKVCKIRTDNGTEFKNATLKAHYDKLGIMQQFLIARMPQQNGVVERRNHTLIERSSDTSINSATQQVHNHEDSPSISSTVVKEHETPPIVTTFDEQTSPISLNEADESYQEDSANFDVIGDPSKPVMTRQRLQTDYEVCMYALTVSTLKPKNIKEAMLDHSLIESMQDELHQFERLDVWELVPRPDGKNIGINFEESFASVARLEAIRMFVAFAAHKNIIIFFRWDVKTGTSSMV
ncbi:retrovirus-related pol polyprotein from transposon TNT 1-94 [Tanacetum coccineum]